MRMRQEVQELKERTENNENIELLHPSLLKMNMAVA